MSRDELEDSGLLEVCTNCGSINLHEYEADNGDKRIVCTRCGIVDFTHTISEEEYEALQKENGKAK